MRLAFRLFSCTEAVARERLAEWYKNGYLTGLRHAPVRKMGFNVSYSFRSGYVDAVADKAMRDLIG